MSKHLTQAGEHLKAFGNQITNPGTTTRAAAAKYRQTVTEIRLAQQHISNAKRLMAEISSMPITEKPKAKTKPKKKPAVRRVPRRERADINMFSL